MTEDRQSKRATRSRTAQTGEKYTEARRALLASGGDSRRADGDPRVAILWPGHRTSVSGPCLRRAGSRQPAQHRTTEPEGHLLRLIVGLLSRSIDRDRPADSPRFVAEDRRRLVDSQLGSEEIRLA